MLTAQTPVRPPYVRLQAITLLSFLLVAQFAAAHPASGIVVDANGRVYFLDTGEPGAFSGFIWQIAPDGTLTAVHHYGGHFLALDAEDQFGRSDLMGWFRAKRTQWLLRTPVAGSASVLIQADGSPIVFGRDGALYYISSEQLERAGVEQIARLARDGTVRTPTPGLPAIAKKLGAIHGLTVDADGMLYISYETAIQKITPAGSAVTVAQNITVTGCDANVPDNGRLPFLRGLAVDSKGVVYAAATGCRAVVRIRENRVETVLTAERPWSPTGIAIRGEEVYVLEYTNHAGRADQWRPRVRKIARDATVTTLATISADDRTRAGSGKIK
jgi:sugar lactone lactonase YvrE